MSNGQLLSEVLNGGAITPEVLWLLLLGIYLYREARRRGLHGFDWFNLPPSMDLIVAVLISDLGVTIRSTTIWIWRKFYGAPPYFSDVQSTLLMVGAALIVVGFLCKIRAMTAPDHGDGPWLLATVSTVVVIAAMLVMR